MRRILFFFLLSAFYFLLTQPAYAAGEFSISYDNIYEVENDLNFAITQNVKITNLTTQYYVSEFSISIGNVKIEQVSAFDESGPVLADVNFSEDQTTIKLKFNASVVGKGQTRKFTLNYSAPELINKSGEILEVSIPKLVASSEISDYNVTLLVPSNFGPLAYITPEPVSSQIAGFGGKNKYFFDKGKLSNFGVSAAFGEKQVFSLSLKYHLFSAKSSKTEIAIPPDNSYQKVIITQIDPEPENIRVDLDGNWLALYELKGGKQLDVIVTGFVQVYPKPRFKSKKVEKPELYLQSQKYWEVEESHVSQKMKELKSPKQIYDFVTSFLSYNQERLNSPTVERLGALGATTNPKNAICMEFTDLFITMARAAGIPAREVNGFAQSSSEKLKPLSLRSYRGDMLHAWPEYWDSQLQTWVQVDPTWGSTSGSLDYFSKMDFGHIAFVHKGLSSTYPIPAGGYKTSADQTGDVNVEFSNTLPTATFEPKLSIKAPKNILSGISGKAKVVIKNLSNQALLLDPLKITVSNLTLKSPQEIEVGVLPPFAFREIDFEIDSPRFLTNQKGEVKAFYGPLTATAAVQIRPFLFFILLAVLFGGLTLFFTIGIGIFLIQKVFKKSI